MLDERRGRRLNADKDKESSVPWLLDNWQQLTQQASASCKNANAAPRTPIFAILDSDDHLDCTLKIRTEILEGHSKQRQSARRDFTAGGGTHFKKR